MRQLLKWKQSLDFLFCFPVEFGLGHMTFTAPKFTKHLLYTRYYSKQFTPIILIAFWDGYPHLQIMEMMHREDK